MTDEMLKQTLDMILEVQDIEEAIKWVRMETRSLRCCHDNLLYACDVHRENPSDKTKEMIEIAEIQIYNYETILIAAQEKLFELIEKTAGVSN